METQTPRIQLTLGTNAPALSLPGNEQIRGALIDNPSGAWLLLRTTNEYVPPYTIGWARSFEYGHASLAIEFPSTGPAGQVSTRQGDRPSVKLFSVPIPNSAGVTSSFIEQFTPNTLVTKSDLVSFSLGILAGTLFAAQANKRWRLIAFAANCMAFTSTPFASFTSHSGYQLHIYGSLVPTAVDFSFHVGPIPPVGLPFQNVQIDFGVGEAVLYDLTPDWADVAAGHYYIAQLI